MAEQYSNRYGGNRQNYKRKIRRRLRPQVKITALIIAVIIFVAVIIVLTAKKPNKLNEKLVGTWVYDEHTQYVFESGGTGKLLADDVVYTYTYSVDGEKLVVDFKTDVVRDCDYAFSINNATLTLVGGNGTDGGSYKLNKK